MRSSGLRSWNYTFRREVEAIPHDIAAKIFFPENTPLRKKGEETGPKDVQMQNSRHPSKR